VALAEGEAHLLQRFPLGRRPRVGIGGVGAPAGQRQVAGPRVTLALGAVDDAERELGSSGEDQSDSGLGLVRLGSQDLGPVVGERLADLIDGELHGWLGGSPIPAGDG
jgi:hypothetical protein